MLLLTAMKLQDQRFQEPDAQLLCPLPLLCMFVWPADGVMLCCDHRFADWFGLMPADCMGWPFTSLGEEPDAIQR